MAEFEMNTEGKLSIRLDSGRLVPVTQEEKERLKGMLNAEDQKWTVDGRALRYDGSISYAFSAFENPTENAEARVYAALCLRCQPELNGIQRRNILDGSSEKCFQSLKDFFNENPQYPIWNVATRREITTISKPYLFYGEKAIFCNDGTFLNESETKAAQAYIDYLTKNQPEFPAKFANQIRGISTLEGLETIRAFVKELDSAAYHRIENGSTAPQATTERIEWRKEGNYMRVKRIRAGETYETSQSAWLSTINENDEPELFQAVLRNQPQMSWDEISKGVATNTQNNEAYKRKLKEMLNIPDRKIEWERDGNQIVVRLMENGRRRDYWLACLKRDKDEALFDAVIRNQPQMSWEEITKGVTNGMGAERDAYKRKLMEIMNMNETTATAANNQTSSIKWVDTYDGTTNPIKAVHYINGEQDDYLWTGLHSKSDADTIKDLIELQPQMDWANLHSLAQRSTPSMVRAIKDAVSKAKAEKEAAKAEAERAAKKQTVTITITFDLNDTYVSAKAFEMAATLTNFTGRTEVTTEIKR